MADRRLARIRRLYDKGPQDYDRAMSSGFSGWLLGGRREKVGEVMRGRALDIGFGTGLSLPHYPPGVQVVGIDASSGMLGVARAAAARLGRQVDLLSMDAEHLAFDDSSFDSVAFNLCLCTIPNPERAVREALRVARPGAAMVFLEHVRSHLQPVALLQDLLNPATVLLQQDHFNRRTAEVVRRAGVQIESTDRWRLGVFTLIVGHKPGAG